MGRPYLSDMAVISQNECISTGQGTGQSLVTPPACSFILEGNEPRRQEAVLEVKVKVFPMLN
jgi:hypothetical protein